MCLSVCFIFYFCSFGCLVFSFDTFVLLLVGRSFGNGGGCAAAVAATQAKYMCAYIHFMVLQLFGFDYVCNKAQIELLIQNQIIKNT